MGSNLPYRLDIPDDIYEIDIFFGVKKQNGVCPAFYTLGIRRINFMLYSIYVYYLFYTDGFELLLLHIASLNIAALVPHKQREGTCGRTVSYRTSSERK